MGSCFAEQVGAKFQEGKFPTVINPYGILYNPVSLATGLSRLLGNPPFGEKDLFEHGGLWHSWMHHGRYSSPSREAALVMMNNHLAEARRHLASAKMLIITLGTAGIYQLKETGEVVANCHKVPAAAFRRRRLSVAEVENTLAEALSNLKEQYPNLLVLLTVSPIRHLRDGLLENQRSKAALLLAAEKLAEASLVEYFPSYEILLDELRDYRFYKADMAHPNDVAVDYIWQRFQEAYFHEKTTIDYSRVMKIVKGFQHRPLHPDTAAHRAFVERLIRKAKDLMQHIPVDFSGEIARIVR